MTWRIVLVPMRTVRQPAARALLAAFLLTAQAGPVAHLITHRPDHTHGPELSPPTGDAAAHAAAHAAGAPHEHAVSPDESRDEGHQPTREELTWLFPAEHHWLGSASRPLGPAGHDHGRESASHFGLALLQAPPPPLVPAPAEALAAPPDTAVPDHDAPDGDAPSARGPPA
jgi:hypothetical protein